MLLLCFTFANSSSSNIKLNFRFDYSIAHLTPIFIPHIFPLTTYVIFYLALRRSPFTRRIFPSRRHWRTRLRRPLNTNTWQTQLR
jgi:hypothetical protein